MKILISIIMQNFHWKYLKNELKIEAKKIQSAILASERIAILRVVSLRLRKSFGTIHCQSLSSKMDSDKSIKGEHGQMNANEGQQKFD